MDFMHSTNGKTRKSGHSLTNSSYNFEEQNASMARKQNALMETEGISVSKKLKMTTLSDSFIHAYEFTLCLHVFRQTGPPRRVDCLAPPPVCHMKMEGFRQVPCLRTQQASLPACSPHYTYMLSAKQGSCEYHFLKVFGMNLLGE